MSGWWSGVSSGNWSASLVSASLFGATDLVTLLAAPLTWGLLLAAFGLWVTLTNRARPGRRLGQTLGGVGLAIVAFALPRLSALATIDEWSAQIVFWLLAAIAVGCSAATVTSRNPVYTAIWFAASLLGVAGLFLFQNAQFLGLATIVVYAGAIVVTFLFVLMLANPEGNSNYDRLTWARFPAPLAILAVTVLVAFMAGAFVDRPPAGDAHPGTLASGDHMAHLGGELFAKHIVSVEVAGTILLVAIVGAVAIVIQGKERRPNRPAPDALASQRNVP